MDLGLESVFSMVSIPVRSELHMPGITGLVARYNILVEKSRLWIFLSKTDDLLH